jgi:hypothetical protein
VSAAALVGMQAADAETGLCTHRPPSPGQAMCECRHQRIELEYVIQVLAAMLRRAQRGPVFYPLDGDGR